MASPAPRKPRPETLRERFLPQYQIGSATYQQRWYWRLRQWWRGLTIDLSLVTMVPAGLGAASLLLAIWTQAFTVSLHWFWTGLWFLALAGVFIGLGAYIRHEGSLTEFTEWLEERSRREE